MKVAYFEFNSNWNRSVSIVDLRTASYETKDLHK